MGAYRAWSHRYRNPFDVSANPVGGCSGGLTYFDPGTGAFTFDQGNCYQAITLTCTALD